MTRKRFVKLNRALWARAGRPEVIRLCESMKLLPGMHMSYRQLWAPTRFMAAVLDVGVPGGRHGR